MAKSSVSEVHTTQGLDFIQELGQQLRVDSIRASTAAGSGHPTSSMSAADLMAVLITRYFRYDWNDPKQPNNDHLIFSKGHASPLLYAIYKAVGVVNDDELLTFRKFGSRLASSTNCRTTSGRSPATASWPKDRSGRASTRRAITDSRTSPPSSTSTGLASVDPPNTSGKPTSTVTGSRRLAVVPS